jgi:16S rRNA (adenine1518-N6/adenine1519-N6)-dimethyltransferase
MTGARERPFTGRSLYFSGTLGCAGRGEKVVNPKTLLEQYGLMPKKSLGQNFLHDPNTLEKIVESAELMPGDTVVEVGPGTGALTAVLAQSAARVIAIELDSRLEPILSDRFANAPNVEIVYGDILETDVLALVGDGPFVVVANVPYYITSAIIRHLLEAPRRPQRMILTVQYEVAERLVAKPGDMGLLSVSAQFYGKPKIVTRLKPGVFWPRPDVDSAVVKLDVYPQSPVDVPSDALFFRVAKAGFGQKRKQLRNSVGEGLGLTGEAAAVLLESAGIDPRRRAETLTLVEWAALTRAYGAHLNQG